MLGMLNKPRANVCWHIKMLVKIHNSCSTWVVAESAIASNESGEGLFIYVQFWIPDIEKISKLCTGSVWHPW